MVKATGGERINKINKNGGKTEKICSVAKILMDTLWHTVHNVILHDILYSMSHTVYKPVIMKEWKIQSSTHK